MNLEKIIEKYETMNNKLIKAEEKLKKDKENIKRLKQERDKLKLEIINISTSNMSLTEILNILSPIKKNNRNR